MKENIKELLRYIVVGGIAFLVDTGVLQLTMMAASHWTYKLYLATFFGFMVGLTVNFILSILYVFKNAKEKTKDKKIQTFIIFGIIGVIGLGLTELGMHTGVAVLGFHHLIVKVFVAGFVMLWNYIARKIIIFK